MSSREEIVPAAERASRLRQRQRLIDACISALHLYGPSRTTVEKVVAIAKLSPGTVNFYFDTKAAMLVETLEFLASEFDSQVTLPVEQLKDQPVRALERLVELYLDPEIASPRKVSVWYAFWGEANSRSEYQDICGKRDESFAALVRDLIDRLIEQTGATQLEADGVALGLIGALEILWQGFAFETEAKIDRKAAKRRCMAYLRSVFPGQFGGAKRPPPREAVAVRRAVSPYASPERLALERDRVFFRCWHWVGAAGDLPEPGDYRTVELLGERAFVLRDSGGGLRAYRNACRKRPHAVATGPSGHFDHGLRCPVDGTLYREDGTLHDGAPGLDRLDVAERGGLVFVRFAESDTAPPDIGGHPMLGPPEEVEVAADWKVMVELWLAASRRVLYPNLLIDQGTVVQVVPLTPGRCQVRYRRFGTAAGEPLADLIAIAESTQTGLTAPGYRGGETGSPDFDLWLAKALGNEI